MKKYTIKELRLLANMTAVQFALELGVTPVTVSLWENGKTKIKDLNLYKVAKFFGVHPAQIIDVSEFNKGIGEASAE